MALLDTHLIVKNFIKHGFSEDQAEVIVGAINDQNTQLVTKNDLKVSILELKTELKTDIHELRTELKTDIHELRTELKSDISELKVSIAEVKIDILKWILPFVATNTLAIIGLIITAFWRS